MTHCPRNVIPRPVPTHSIPSATIGETRCGVHNMGYGNHSHPEVSTIENYWSPDWNGHHRDRTGVHNTCLHKHFSITHTYRHFSRIVILVGDKDPEKTTSELEVREKATPHTAETQTRNGLLQLPSYVTRTAIHVLSGYTRLTFTRANRF